MVEGTEFFEKLFMTLNNTIPLDLSTRPLGGGSSVFSPGEVPNAEYQQEPVKAARKADPFTFPSSLLGCSSPQTFLFFTGWDILIVRCFNSNHNISTWEEDGNASVEVSVYTGRGLECGSG